jgi:triosephosphate isomerase (TIM)
MTQRKKCIFLVQWSGYPSLESTEKQLEKLISDVNFDISTCCIGFPFSTCLSLREKYRDSPLILGADNILNIQEGSFTEPIAARLLAESNIPFVIMDSSLPDANLSSLSKQIPKLLQLKVNPYIRFGESQKDYESGNAKSKISAWIADLLKDISPHLLINMNLVYDPLWIQSMPWKPSLEDLIKAYQQCREILQEHAGQQIGKEIPLICSFPYDLNELSTLRSQCDIDGFYFHNGGLNTEKLHQFIVNFKEKPIQVALQELPASPQPSENTIQKTEEPKEIIEEAQVKPEIPLPESESLS